MNEFYRYFLVKLRFIEKRREIIMVPIDMTHNLKYSIHSMNRDINRRDVLAIKDFFWIKKLLC